MSGRFNVGASPMGVAFDGANIWVANFMSHTVSKRKAGNACPGAIIAIAKSFFR